MPVLSIPSLLRQLKKVTNDRRYEIFYRGHADKSWSLTPSIYRKGLIKHEDKIYKEIILRVPNEFIDEPTTIEKLVKMQHYGLPTRLLDLTTNPLVALYFAVSSMPNKSGELIILKIPKYHIKYADSDSVTVLANLAKMKMRFGINHGLKLIEGLEDDDESRIEIFNSQGSIQLLNHEIKSDKSYFQSIIEPETFSQVLTVKVKMSNNRIIRQNGAFLLFGFRNQKIVPARVPDLWVLNHNSSLKLNLTITGRTKQSILDELDALNINESSLFPELQNQATYLKTLYSR